MKRFFITVIVCCAVHFSLNAEETWTMQWGGLPRSCLVEFPTSRTGQTGLPVIFALHGYGATATAMRNYSKLHLLGDSVGFITVYPDAYNHRWNSGIGDNPSYPTLNVDDVGFFSRLIDSLISRYAIDTQRVYCCGHSNGGFMSIKLAAQLSNRIAAAASLSGVLTNSTAAGYSAKRPVSLLMIHGTADQVVPFDGGMTGWFSVGATLSFWISKNNSLLPPDTIALPDRDTNDQSTVVKYTYRSAVNTSKIELLKVIGGGHTWPGAAPSPQFGATNNDINANDELWDFFKQFTMTIDAVPEMKNYPTGFLLSQNYPNPFNPSTTVEFRIQRSEFVILKVFDLLGRKVATLVNEVKQPGTYTVQWDATGAASGMYFYRLIAASFVETRKMMVLK